MNNHAIHYIIRFLLGEDISEEIVAAIGYTNNSKHYDRYSIVIIPSGFFTNHIYGTASSLPELPLQEIEGTPLLFGSPLVEQIGDTLVIHADIIASTYFLITRYEEIIQRNYLTGQDFSTVRLSMNTVYFYANGYGNMGSAYRKFQKRYNISI